MKLVWDSSTNNQDCDRYVKAGTESEEAKFNFYEADLEPAF